jgi:DNA repair protein RAD50
MKEDLKSAEEELVTAKSVTSFYDSYLRLETSEIPKLEKEIKSVTTKLSEANKGVDTRSSAVNEIRTEMKALESLKRPVQDISRFTKEVEELRREIARFENLLGEAGGSLSGAEIRTKMDSLNEQRAKLQREQKGLGSEKEKARLRIQGMKDQISSLRFKLGEGENKVNAKKTFLRDLEEAKSQLRKAHEDVKVQYQGSFG